MGYLRRSNILNNKRIYKYGLKAILRFQFTKIDTLNISIMPHVDLEFANKIAIGE